MINSITISGAEQILHISFKTKDELFVSDKENICLVDSAGKILNSGFEGAYYPSGSHTVTDDLDFLFVDTNGVHKLSPDGVIATPFYSPEPHCIHSSHINGDILVGSFRKVTRYDRNGRKLNVINYPHVRYIHPVYITENKNGDIWTSDNWIAKVTVVDRSGGHRFDYTGPFSHFCPRALCADVLGHVLVCDCHNDSVYLLDQDGNFLSLLLTQEIHEIYHPTALCVDDQHNLYIGQEYSNTICVYKYLQNTDVKHSTDQKHYSKNTEIRAPKRLGKKRSNKVGDPFYAT